MSQPGVRIYECAFVYRDTPESVPRDTPGWKPCQWLRYEPFTDLAPEWVFCAQGSDDAKAISMNYLYKALKLAPEDKVQV